MRSILVTVDDTPSAIAARALAVALARQCGAHVRGVTALDVSDLEGAEAVPIGGAQFGYERYRRRQELAKERRARVAQLPELFERSLAESGMQAACTTINADIRAGLLRIVETCDLVVTGRDTEFHLEPLEGVTPLVDHIIAKGCRPVVVCGPEWNERGPVVVAYDGSAPSAKALQIAALMGIFGSADVRVVSVSRETAVAAMAVERARSFLEAHGVMAEVEVIEFDRTPCRPAGKARCGDGRKAARHGCLRSSRPRRHSLWLHDPALVRQRSGSAVHPSLSRTGGREAGFPVLGQNQMFMGRP